MKGIGFVRRIDDLGRVVIPREIRRMLRLHDGDPMELFVDGDSVIFKRYSPLCESDWEHMRDVLSPVLPNFYLLDRYGNPAIAMGVDFPNKESADADASIIIYPVHEMDETLGYLAVGKNVDQKLVEIALEQYKMLLKDRGM